MKVSVLTSKGDGSPNEGSRLQEKSNRVDRETCKVIIVEVRLRDCRIQQAIHQAQVTQLLQPEAAILSLCMLQQVGAFFANHHAGNAWINTDHGREYGCICYSQVVDAFDTQV